MTPEDALLRAIVEEPDNDLPRLIYADWLEEHGAAARAEFIRVQVELEPLREQWANEQREALERREEVLLREHRLAWEWGSTPLSEKFREEITTVFRRGFVETIGLPVQWFLEDGAAIRALCPLLRRVDLHRVAGWGERLARAPLFEGLEEAQIACWITGADAAAIASSPTMRHLGRLTVWLGYPEEDEAICEALLGCANWPHLRELRVVGAAMEPEECRAAFALLAEGLGRGLDRFINPWDRLFAFAPAGSFALHFPGRLPDGTQVFGMMPQGDESALHLLLFDPEGNPVGEREVELPERVLQLSQSREGSWWERQQRICRETGRFLQETLGHQPHLIRVRSLVFRGQSLVGDYDFQLGDEMGVPDEPDYRPEDDEYFGAGGRGGGMYSWMESGSFVWCDVNMINNWVDKRGIVYST
jgi:uncharacterized protein (TIGR02996 family)